MIAANTQDSSDAGRPTSAVSAPSSQPEPMIERVR